MPVRGKVYSEQLKLIPFIEFFVGHVSLNPLKMDRPRPIKHASALGAVNVGTLSAFNEYASATSWTRVAQTCIFTMAPAFTIMISIDLLPLAPVQDGWAANWVLWIRCFITGYFTAIATFMEYKDPATAAGLSKRSMLLIAVGGACGISSSLILFTKYWIFPIPFTLMTLTPFWFLSLLTCSVVTVGWKNVRSNKVLREQLGRMMSLTFVQSQMLFLYPAYNAGFIALSGLPQLAFIIVLPAIKHFVKWHLNRARDATTSNTVLATSSADLFEALYLFKCMQSTGSIQSGIALVVVDLIQNIYHLYGLHKKIRVLEGSMSDSVRLIDGYDVIHSFLMISSSRRGILPKRNAVSPQSSHSKMPTKAVLRVRPLPDVATINELNAAVESFFFKCQEVLLVEFIETIVPLFYVLYSILLFHLPNAKYYPEMQHLTTDKLYALVRNIAIYAGLELLSLVYVHVVLKWRFNISAMHLLAFTLESEQAAFQGSFINWVLVNLQITLVHYGALCAIYVAFVQLTGMLTS